MIDKLRTQFQYDSKILLTNSYWLLVVPLVASQLVVLWHMAVAAVVKPGTVASACELVVPLMAAFLCAHVVTPEHRHRVDELTFVRPVSALRTVFLRLIALYTLTILLAAVMLFVYKVGLKQEFALGTMALASIPPVVFLSMLSMAFAAAWRTPAAGIGAAFAYWIVDAAWGGRLNPLFGLHQYSVALDRAEDGYAVASGSWLASKGVLLVLGLAAAWAAGRALGRPAAPKRWRAGLRLAGGTAACAVLYLISGALWQFQVAREQAQQDPLRARQAYADVFSAYGPVPVAYLFGPDFAAYSAGAPAGGDDFAAITTHKEETIERLRRVADRWPEGHWADDALFEVVRLRPVTGEDTPEAQQENRLTLALSNDFLARYPTSRYAPYVAARSVILARRLDDEETMMAAYRRVTGVYGGSPAATEAAAEMQAYYLERGEEDRAIECARLAAASAPPETRPDAELSLADFLAQNGHLDEAREVYTRVQASVQAKLEALGLAVLTPETATEENLARRAEIMKLRSRARDGIAALDTASPPPAASEPAG
jgi:hypothetical protein